MWRSIGSVISSNKNTGAIAETSKNDPTTATFNTVVHGVGGGASANYTTTYEGVFYAYINNIRDDNTWRYTIVFASSDVADEWWRAVSTSTIDILVNNIQRITPQFYTHDINLWNVANFFTESKLTTLSAPFKGKIFFALENDRGGRGISIIPPLIIVDSISGNWFAIRSKANPNHHWYYDEGLGCVLVSDTKRTLFKVTAPDVHEGAIMIGSDNITLVAQHHGFILPNELSNARTLGVTTEQSQAFKFTFKDLKLGKFAPGTETLPSPLCYIAEGGAGTGWQLAV